MGDEGGGTNPKAAAAAPTHNRADTSKKKSSTEGEGGHVIVQVGDNDLTGGKFNGYDLHLLLRKKNIDAYHIVRNKQSDDDTTIRIPSMSGTDFSRQIMRIPEFLKSDLVHLHLIHNTDFDINMLPLFTRLKPTVITLHDPFFLGGHCIHHGSCEKWETGCYDCEHMDAPFAIEEDDSALRFETKKIAIQNANLSVIVASRWMEHKVRRSPVFEGKKIYLQPFGVDQNIFYPANASVVRQSLGITKTGFVLLFRADSGPFKGLDILWRTLSDLAASGITATLLTVGQKGLLKEFKNQFDIKEYGWVNDDAFLAKLYQACDIFLMPSRLESFGLMGVEAMYCGKVVLALNADTALPDTVCSPECGIAADEEGYAKMLKNLLYDPALRKVSEQASLQYARTHYSEAGYIKGILDIYEDVIGRFAPDINTGRVISQLTALADGSKHGVTGGEEDAPGRMMQLDGRRGAGRFRSFSWRITKPLRAFGEMRHAPGGFFAKIVFFCRYWSEPEAFRTDDEIAASVSWRITAPMRAVHSLVQYIMTGRQE